MKEIKIQELENIKIGSAENKDAATGCTVILCEQGMAAGLDVRGGGPASPGNGALEAHSGGRVDPCGAAVRRQRLWAGCGRRRNGVSGGAEYRLRCGDHKGSPGVRILPVRPDGGRSPGPAGPRLWAMRPVRMRKRAITGTGISVPGPEPLWESFTDRSFV